MVVEEFGNAMLPIREFIKLLDGQKHKLNMKYGHTFGQWTEVFITTNLRWPEEIYTGALPRHRAALFRRIDVVEEMNRVWIDGVQQPAPLARQDAVLGPYVAANGFIFPVEN